MRKVFEMGMGSGGEMDGGDEKNSRFEGWRELFGAQGIEVLLKKRPVFAMQTKREGVRGMGTLNEPLLAHERIDFWNWRMGSLLELFEKGADLGWKDGLDDGHKRAAFGATARIATEGALKEFVPRDAHLFGKDLGLFEQGVRLGQQRASKAVGQETVVADTPKMEVGDVSDEPSDEVQRGEGEGDVFVGIMIEVFEGDPLPVIGQDAGLPEGRALEVTAEVFGGGAVIVGVEVEMDDPFFLVQRVEPRVESRVMAEVGESFGEVQSTELMLLTKEVDDLKAPHGFEFFVVEKAFGAPVLAILGKAADGGGQMDVEIALEMASEGMNGQENAGVEPLFARQRQDEVGRQRGDPREEVAVEPEEFPKPRGHGERDVLPSGVGQNIELGFDPFIGGLLSARGTEAGFAGMGDGLACAARGTLLDVSAQKHGFAGHHFEHVDEDAVSEFGMKVDEMLPPIPKNGP
jgi:hypothetical protein